jgi:hypothetical protein
MEPLQGGSAALGQEHRLHQAGVTLESFRDIDARLALLSGGLVASDARSVAGPRLAVGSSLGTGFVQLDIRTRASSKNAADPAVSIGDDLDSGGWEPEADD